MALYLGLDIGKTAVKCVSLRSAYRRLRLESVALVELSEFGGDRALAVQAAMARLFAGKPVQHDGIAVALDGDLASQKVVQLPATAQKQLAEVLPLQLADELPFEIDDAVWDYRLLRTSAKGEAGAAPMLQVQTVVARLLDVRARIDEIHAALAHEPERVGVGAYPLANLAACYPELATASGDEVIALLDLGQTQSDLLLLGGGQVLFSRTLSNGTEGLPGTADKLARELRVSFMAHRARGGVAPSRLVVAGGGAFVSGAEVFLGAQLGVPTALLGPPQLELELAVRGKNPGAPDPRLPLVQAALPQFARYAKALGLALGLTSRAVDFDLRQGPLAYERGFGWLKQRMPQLTAFAVVFGVALLVSSTVRWMAVNHEHDVLSEALGKVTLEVLGEEATEAEAAFDLLANQSETADADPMPHADAFDVLNFFAKNIPETIAHDLDEVDVQKGKVTVHGVVDSVSEAQEILGHMKSERCVAEPKIVRTTQAVGSTRQKYVMEFELRCPEDIKTTRKKSSSSEGQ